MEVKDRLSDALTAAGVDLVLLSDPADVCYVTGFEVPPPVDVGAAFSSGPSLALASPRGSRVLLVPNAYSARANETSRADETILVPTHFGQLQDIGDEEEALSSTLRIALQSAGVDTGRARVGIDRRTLPEALSELLRSELPDAELVDARPLLAHARRLKTPHELDLLRRAVALADVGQEALMELAAHGRTEIEALGDVITRIQAAAGRTVTWAGELVTGARTGRLRYPGGPIDQVMARGDTVLMDLSVRYCGYWADCCNTFVLESDPTDTQLRYFRAARAAFDAAIEELRPGRRASDVHAAAERELERHGFRSVHYTGHQLGASVNELPRLVPYDHTPIEAGMVFAVEPGVYGKEAGTGARTEKVVLVTPEGPDILSRFPWGMES